MYHDSMPSWAPVCLFGVCTVSFRDAERLGGCGSGVFIGVEVDWGEGRWLGGTKQVNIETFLEIIVLYIFTHTHTHTHTCAYINSMDPQECNKEGRINTQNIQIFTAKYYKYFTISVW